MKTDLTLGATIPPMNADKPTPAPQDSTSAEPAEVDEPAEPTVVLSGLGDSGDGEPTVTLPAAEISETTADSGSEPTADLSAAVSPAADSASGGDGSEPTVALPAAEIADVATEVAEETADLSAGEVAAASAADESEPTTVISTESEPTIALPKPRPSPESTVTPPPSEPTIALPAPGTSAVPRPQEKLLTRRRLLWAIPGAALVGGTIAALADRGKPEATKTPNLVVSEPAPSQVPAPAPTTPRPTTQVMKFPVRTLEDFRKVVPGEPFPTDAIALTIDDGPHPIWTPAILRLLEKHHVPALFCMIGNQVLGHEATARDVAADGHLIANHTWSHPIKLAKLPSHVVLKEIHRAQDKIYSTTGFAPSLFRSPGGAWSEGLSKSVSHSGVIPMDWTTDPRDWSRPGVAHITKRLLAAKPGQILLCHDGGGDRSQTLASLKTVIPALQAKGLKFVALM